MKITNLLVGNYKNLKIDIEHDSDLIALIGNNGSGKSNMLEALSIIFKSLYDPEGSRVPLDFNLEYIRTSGQSVLINKIGSKFIFKVNGVQQITYKDFLPKRVISIYSGEDDRLWKQCYEPFYLEYVRKINKGNTSQMGDLSSTPRMLYLNKFYWNISLLCLILSDSDDNKNFIKDILLIDTIDKIKFEFDTENYKEYNNNLTLEFINQIDKKSEYTLNELKKIINDYSIPIDDVFRYLYIAYSPKQSKILKEVIIKFNDHLTLEDLSEGSKKLILIKAALEFAGQEDCLFILDEPDAHIHINNKEQITNILNLYKSNRQILFTTHSPTLTQCIANENVYMINKGKIIDKSKQEVIQELTGKFWNTQQQNIFLASNKDLILVEGKTDIKYLNTALSKLKSVFSKYNSIEFEYLPFGGADGLENFIDKFKPNHGQKVIAFLDRDGNNKRAGKKAFMKIFGLNKIESDEPKYRIINELYVALLPKTAIHPNDNFMMEDYFGTKKIIDECHKLLDNELTSDFGGMKKINSEIKELLPELCKSFDGKDFEGFTILFDLILEIKGVKETSTVISKSIFKISGKKFRARSFYNELDKSITILKDSIISKDISSRISWSAKRQDILKGKTKPNNDNLILLEDIKMSSPSGAFTLCSGKEGNGWNLWKDDNGQTLDEVYRKKLKN
jgi:ABC-type cobalamin/Fe3+-siderophores transport system ATPase subunit